MRVSPLLSVATAVAAVALSASPAVAAVSASGERDYPPALNVPLLAVGTDAPAAVAGHGHGHNPGPPSPTPTPPSSSPSRSSPAPSPSASGPAVSGSPEASPSASVGLPTPTAASSRQDVVTPSAPRSTPAPADNPAAPAGTTSSTGTSSGGSGLLVGGLGVVVAAGGGVVLWRRLRKKRGQRPKTAPLAPITIWLAPRAPRDPLALPSSAYAPAGQGQAQRTLVWPPPETSFVEQEPPPLSGLPGPYKQAPWEQLTMVDLRWDPPVGGRAPEPQAVPPPAQPTAGRHAGPARHPDMAQQPTGYPAQENGRALGKRRKPQQ